MAYQTDENGNLYDENSKFLAKAWEYSVDENWNVQISPQKEENSIEELQTVQEISMVQTESKSIFQKINDFFKSFFSWDHVKELALSESLWLAVKWEKSEVSYEDKFPSELNVSEDLRRFVYNISNVWKLLFSDSVDKKNAPRWKLFFVWRIDIVDFLDQLSTLIYAWIRLIDAIRIIRKQSEAYSMKILYTSIEEKLNNWKHLSESLWDYDYIFPTKWIKLILAAEKYDNVSPINLGSEYEISIKDLAIIISKIMKFSGEVTWDTTKGNGQPRRCVSNNKAEREIGFKPKTSLNEGLEKMIAWFESNN